MAKQCVNIGHIVQAPYLDSSVSPTAKQLMRTISESQACDDVFVAGTATQRAYVLTAAGVPNV